jgi:hypothetical protein
LRHRIARSAGSPSGRSDIVYSYTQVSECL